MKTNFSPCISAFLMEREERASSGIFDYMSKVQRALLQKSGNRTKQLLVKTSYKTHCAPNIF